MESNDKWTFIMDIDGVFTDGTFLYDENGKAYKKFGPDDSGALKLIKDDVNLVFISADKRGFPISSKRISDMGYELKLIREPERLSWIKENFDTSKVIYMGDSFVDIEIFLNVACSICPSDGFYIATKYATHVTFHGGGHRAVAEAAFYIANTFLGKTTEQLLGI